MAVEASAQVAPGEWGKVFNGVTLTPPAAASQLRHLCFHDGLSQDKILEI
jgi:hypothetical protein